MILAEGLEDPGALRVRGRQSQGRLVELDRLVDRVALVGARTGEHQVPDRALANPLAVGRVRPGCSVGVLFDRKAVVLADQARQLGLRIVRDPFQPGSDRGVRPRPMRVRHRAVRRVAKEGVLEAQLDLAGQARRRAGEDQAPLVEAAQRVADVGGPEGQPDRSFPEDASHHRGLLQHAPLGEWQGLDPRDEHRLDRVRDRGTAGLGEVADRLLQEVGVPLGSRDHRRAHLVRQRAGGHHRIHQARGIAGVQRRNLDRRETLVRHEPRLTTQERRAGGRDEQELAIELRRDRGQRRDQRGSRPVEILDDEDRAAATRVGLEEPRPRLVDRQRDEAGLAALEGVAGDDDPRGRRQGVDRLVRFGLGQSERRQDASESVAESLFGRLRAIVQPDAAGASEDFAEGPVARPTPRREAAALEDRGGGRALASRGQELANEAALADPGRAVQEHEAWLSFAKRIVEGADQRLELGRAPDERRLVRGMTHDRFASRRP